MLFEGTTIHKISFYRNMVKQFDIVSDYCFYHCLKPLNHEFTISLSDISLKIMVNGIIETEIYLKSL